MVYEYDIPSHKKGDTFAGAQFTITVNGSPLDLTNATIKMDMRKKNKTVRALRISNEESVGGITIITPASGIFKIDKQVIDVPAAIYDYDIECTLANGEVKTYISGTWKIIQDTTYG